MTPGRVLVTGATGLLGRALLERLSQGPFETIGVARSAPERNGFVSADLVDPAGAQAAIAFSPEAIVHLAGTTGADETELVRNNISATRSLLQAVADFGLRPYVIVAGSAAEYEESAGLIGEDSPVGPVTAYGRIKAAQTELARNECAAAGIPLTVLRPFNVVSPDLPASTALGNMRRQLLAQRGSPRTLRCGRLDVVRDYVTARFVAETIVRLLEVDDRPPVLNVCSGVGIELRAIVDALAGALQTTLEILQDPQLLALPAAPRVVGDPARLARLGLEFRPTPTALASALLDQ